MNGFKKVVLFLKVIVCPLMQLTFGNVLHDIVLKYDNLDKSKLRRFEKLSIKLKKADLDLTFLSNCRTFNVIPKFLAYNLPYTNDEDSRFIRKRLLRSAIKKRRDERYRLEKQLQNIRAEICAILSSTDKYIIQHLIDQNVQKMVKVTIKTHEKKLKNLTKNSVLLFTPTDTVLNLSSIKLTEEELRVLTYGLKHPTEPTLINKTDLLNAFDFIHRAMSKDLKDNRDAGEVKAKLSY